jgi:protein-S-isoprenylcysteine O-methyltransferase Ste14
MRGTTITLIITGRDHDGTFSGSAAAYVSLEVQIRSEEAFLERAHGQTYRDYRARVRRWL